jgi:hypothetical protein
MGYTMGKLRGVLDSASATLNFFLEATSKKPGKLPITRNHKSHVGPAGVAIGQSAGSQVAADFKSALSSSVDGPCPTNRRPLTPIRGADLFLTIDHSVPERRDVPWVKA